MYHTFEINPNLLRLCIWNCNEYQWNVGFGIEDFTDDSDITLLVETWEHDTQRIQGLRNYKVHCLIWVKNPRQRRGQGGVVCLIKKEIEKYLLIIKNDEHNSTYGSK